MRTEPEALLQLRHMLESFIDGPDRSIEAVNEIGGLLVQCFADDDGFGELLIASASYQPGGGEYLYDEESMRRVCRVALKDIQSRLGR